MEDGQGSVLKLGGQRRSRRVEIWSSLSSNQKARATRRQSKVEAYGHSEKDCVPGRSVQIQETVNPARQTRRRVSSLSSALGTGRLRGGPQKLDFTHHTRTPYTTLRIRLAAKRHAHVGLLHQQVKETASNIAGSITRPSSAPPSPSPVRTSSSSDLEVPLPRSFPLEQSPLHHSLHFSLR